MGTSDRASETGLGASRASDDHPAGTPTHPPAAGGGDGCWSCLTADDGGDKIPLSRRVSRGPAGKETERRGWAEGRRCGGGRALESMGGL